MRRFLVLVTLLTVGCSSWRTAARYERWTLYEPPGQGVAAERFADAFTPAFAAIEATLGPFRRRVAVHAWDEESQPVSTRADPIGTGVHQVPGIGPARIQAYHARASGAFGRSGVYIGAPDPGTAVHELVHARFAELDARLPLWFEEGVAGVLGDGLVVDGSWQVDGFACWPLRELREEHLDDEHLARLLDMRASDRSSVRDNVLVHFVGWAVVFDLYRESRGRIEWEDWLAHFEGNAVAEVRRRMDRTLGPDCEAAWLTRLADPRREVRLATAKGLWKLRSREVLDALLGALEVEADPEVRIGLAVNALATAGELPLSWRRWRTVEQEVRAALRTAELEDPREQRAALDLYRAYRRGDDRNAAQDALQRLARFWEE